MGFYFDNFIFLMEIECAVCLSEDGETLPHLQSCCLDAHTECTNSHCGEFAAHLWTNRLRNRRAFIALSPCRRLGLTYGRQPAHSQAGIYQCSRWWQAGSPHGAFRSTLGLLSQSCLRCNEEVKRTAASVCSIQKINDAFFTWNICSDRFLFYKQFA